MKITSFQVFLNFGKRIAYQVLPPLLFNLIKRFKKKTSVSYARFEDALLKCNNLGYSNADIVDQVKSKTLKLKFENFKKHDLSESDLRILLMASRYLGNGSLKVLDFGGGAGYHYYLFKSWFPKCPKVEWVIVETELMVEMCNDLQNPELKFVSDIPTENDSPFDLVVAASSIQYTCDPVSILARLLQIKATSFCMTKTPMLSYKDKLITVQASILSDHGPGKSYSKLEDKLILTPITFIYKETVSKMFEQNYARFQLTQDARSSFEFNGREIPTFSAFCSAL
jgi:putative methyltransferase (TIGR04325 family)